MPFCNKASQALLAGWVWLPLHGNEGQCFIWISQAPTILVPLYCFRWVYSEFTSLWGTRIRPLAALFPRNTKSEGPKSVICCMNADKEKLCSESDQLPGRVNVVVTETRDLLWGLCRSHLQDLGCFWVLPYPNCWVLRAESEGNIESATKCVPSSQNPHCMLQLQLLLALPLAIFFCGGQSSCSSNPLSLPPLHI